MRIEDAAAHGARTLRKREVAKQRTAAKQQAARQAREARRGSLKRPKVEATSKQHGGLVKRRVLGDVTNQPHTKAM
jgi:hypothetical protein